VISADTLPFLPVFSLFYPLGTRRHAKKGKRDEPRPGLSFSSGLFSFWGERGREEEWRRMSFPSFF